MFELTYTHEIYAYLAPLLILIRKTGFFEAYVFMPTMSLLALVLFWRLKTSLENNGTFDDSLRMRAPKTWLFAYFTLCFILTNATAVAFKTMIFEETDYEQFYWFVPWVSPLHFYISSVAGAMLWIILRNRQSALDKALSIYTQLGFIGGYCVATYRLFNEPFDITDPTSGVSSLFFYLWLGLLNVDIIIRHMPSSSLKLNACSPSTIESEGEAS